MDFDFLKFDDKTGKPSDTTKRAWISFLVIVGLGILISIILLFTKVEDQLLELYKWLAGILGLTGQGSYLFKRANDRNQLVAVEQKPEEQKSIPEQKTLKIIENLCNNIYARPKKKLKEVRGIILHWVGNPGTSPSANRNYWDGLKGKYASAHYIIGIDGQIIRTIPEDEVAYHAGTNIRTGTELAKKFSNQQNFYTIGIEHCHPDWSGVFTEDTYKASVELVAMLLKKYNLTVNNIYRHYDFSGKNCPKWLVDNNEAFRQYKIDVSTLMNIVV